MPPVQPFDVGIARQIGHYSDAVRVPAGYDHIVVSGTPGLTPDGTLPDDMTGQATHAWRNVEMILRAASATLADIVAVRQWPTSSDDIAAYVTIRSSFLTHKTRVRLHAGYGHDEGDGAGDARDSWLMAADKPSHQRLPPLTAMS